MTDAYMPIVNGGEYRSRATGTVVRVYGLGPVQTTDEGTFEAVYYEVCSGPKAGDMFYVSRDRFREFFQLEAQ